MAREINETEGVLKDLSEKLDKEGIDTPDLVKKAWKKRARKRCIVCGKKIEDLGQHLRDSEECRKTIMELMKAYNLWLTSIVSLIQKALDSMVTWLSNFRLWFVEELKKHG